MHVLHVDEEHHVQWGQKFYSAQVSVSVVVVHFFVT